MEKTFKATIYPKGYSVEVEVTIEISCRDEDEPGEFEIEMIRSENYEYDYEELSIDDQEDIMTAAQKWADKLAYEAYLDYHAGRADYEYDQWVDRQSEES